MGICSYIRKTLHSERGSVTVLAALSLPLLLAFGGMAVDLGNFYSHHANLENAAESAAIAGGRAFRTALQEGKTRDVALEEAVDLGGYHAEVNLPNTNYKPNYESKDVTLPDGNTATLLRITLSEDVDYHFLRPLLRALGSQEYITLSAAGYCTMIDIHDLASGGNPMFNDMFVFDAYKDKWWSGGNMGLILTNNVQNPDNAYLQQNINSLGTYTGGVRAANKEAYDLATAPGNIRHDTLLTKYAFEDGYTTVQSAIDRQKELDTLKLNGLDLDSLSYEDREKFLKDKLADWNDSDSLRDPTTRITYPLEDIDITQYYWETIEPMQNNSGTRRLTERSNLNSDDINLLLRESDNLNCIFVNTNGTDLNLNKPITPDKDDKPLYIIVRNATNTHINGDLASGRSVILVLTGYEDTEDPITHQRDNAGSNIDGANGTFRGIIYAPFGKVFINDNGFKFDGSIVSKGIQTQSNGYYSHTQNYTSGGGTSNSKPNDVRVVYGGSDYW